MHETAAEALCIVYADTDNDSHLLYVARWSDFPFEDFELRKWRVVARGVEVPQSGVAKVNTLGFYEVRYRSSH